MKMPDVIGHDNQSQHYQHHRCLCLDLSGRITTPDRFTYHAGTQSSLSRSSKLNMLGAQLGVETPKILQMPAVVGDFIPPPSRDWEVIGRQSTPLTTRISQLLLTPGILPELSRVTICCALQPLDKINDSLSFLTTIISGEWQISVERSTIIATNRSQWENVYYLHSK